MLNIARAVKRTGCRNVPRSIRSVCGLWGHELAREAEAPGAEKVKSMRFGTFSLPISRDPASDGAVIDQTLREIELAEELGFDCVWLSEHHFSGTCAYADPIVFATAVAMRTKAVKIGFAVVQLALHHPVRLAVQTALLDHLSKGRLIVGTARGSGFNAYEYLGFGTTLAQGREMAAEAEDLLLKAWTADDVDHEGKFWRASFPRLRPRPYQQPHPPLVRACESEGSLIEMAKRGRPVLLGASSLATLRARLDLYRDTMRSAGFGEQAVQDALDATWVQRFLYITDSQATAREDAARTLEGLMTQLREYRERYNPVPDSPSGNPDGSPPAMRPVEVVEYSTIFGTPDSVAEQIAELRDAGVRNILLPININQMPFDQVSKSMRVFQAQVAHRFRGSGQVG